MIVRFGDARMPGVVVHIDVVDLLLRGGEIVEGFSGGDAFTGIMYMELTRGPLRSYARNGPAGRVAGST